MMNWIKLCDRKPGYLDWVILSNGFEVTTGYYGTEGFQDIEHDMGAITHWMPFPDAPQDEKQQQPEAYVIAELLTMIRILQDNVKVADWRIKELQKMMLELQRNAYDDGKRIERIEQRIVPELVIRIEEGQFKVSEALKSFK